jgi:hypothetical protein
MWVRSIDRDAGNWKDLALPPEDHKYPEGFFWEED